MIKSASRMILEALNPEIIHGDGDLIGEIDKTDTHGHTGRIIFKVHDEKIGDIWFDFGPGFSPKIPASKKELYLATIEVQKSHRGNDYSSKMIDVLKDYAKEIGADVITLRADYGLGTPSKRGGKLEQLYIKNGFKYSFTEEECKENEELSLTAMQFDL